MVANFCHCRVGRVLTGWSDESAGPSIDGGNVRWNVCRLFGSVLSITTGGGVVRRNVESSVLGGGSSCGCTPVTVTGWMALLVLLVAITLPAFTAPVVFAAEFVLNCDGPLPAVGPTAPLVMPILPLESVGSPAAGLSPFEVGFTPLF